MGVEEALELADQLIHAKTGKHLNDLESQVFLGSWKGDTYEKIYPINPEYVEKDVGYKLWKKLSSVLGEKVTKKNFRGALERSLKRKSRIFISHGAQEPDLSLAEQLCLAFNASGHQAFTATVGANLRGGPQPGEDWQDLRIRPPSPPNLGGTGFTPPKVGGHRGPLWGWGGTGGQNDGVCVSPDWFAHIDAELEKCNYFLLLLSPQSAVSEMVIEELRRAKELRDSRRNHQPIMLPIRVNCPLSVPLNHDLRSYLQGIGQREWKSPSDTPILIQEILNLLAKGDGGWEIDQLDGLQVEDGLQVGSLQAAGSNQSSNLPFGFSSRVQLSTPPQPVAEPELPSGQVRLESAFYVERYPCEALCYKEILQPGALIRIKAPRQMGKTSLMARILYQAKEQGHRTVPLSFQHADKAVFTNLNELLKWFCARITRKLRLPHQVDDYWTDTYGSKDNCTVYFEDYLLSETDEPLVLGLDEVDRVFQYPQIADDFLGLLRAWYEEAGYGDGNSKLWEKLRLVVVHSTEVYVPLNVNQSPFNVGLPIELPEFSPKQVQDLTRLHSLDWNARQVEQLMSIVGGHPYLVRVALYHIATGQLTLEQLLQIAPTEAGLYGDHLRRHLWTLQQHPELAAGFAKVVTTSEPVELESVLAFKLHSMGLVQLQGNYVTPRFDLYRQYFCLKRSCLEENPSSGSVVYTESLRN